MSTHQQHNRCLFPKRVWFQLVKATCLFLITLSSFQNFEFLVHLISSTSSVIIVQPSEHDCCTNISTYKEDTGNRNISIEMTQKEAERMIESKYNLTVVVPGLGNPDRMQILRRSLETIQFSFTKRKTAKQNFNCIVYVWNISLVMAASQALSSCEVIYNAGLWTHHMKRVAISKNSSTTHVAILMDDIDLTSKNLDTAKMLDRMQSKGYDMMSAAVQGWFWDVLRPRQNCISHRTDYADILYVVFELKAWLCWQKTLNLDINQYGWGYDLTFASICNTTVGVMDAAVAIHDYQAKDCTKAGGECTRSYDREKAIAQEGAWIQHVRKNFPEVGKLKAAETVDDFKSYVTKRRAGSYPECDDSGGL